MKIIEKKMEETQERKIAGLFKTFLWLPITHRIRWKVLLEIGKIGHGWGTSICKVI